MRKIITAVVLVALLVAGAFFLSERVFKQPQNEMTSITFTQVDDQGQTNLDVKITREGDKAKVHAAGALLGDKEYDIQVEKTLFSSAEDLVESLKVGMWKSISTEPIEVPAGQVGVLITYADGSCISATSEGLPAGTAQKAIETVDKWTKDLISGQLGTTGNPLLDLFKL